MHQELKDLKDVLDRLTENGTLDYDEVDTNEYPTLDDTYKVYQVNDIELRVFGDLRLEVHVVSPNISLWNQFVHPSECPWAYQFFAYWISEIDRDRMGYRKELWW